MTGWWAGWLLYYSSFLSRWYFVRLKSNWNYWLQSRGAKSPILYSCQFTLKKDHLWIGQKCDLRAKLGGPPTRRTKPSRKWTPTRSTTFARVVSQESVNQKYKDGRQGGKTERASDQQTEGANVDAQVRIGEWQSCQLYLTDGNNQLEARDERVPRIWKNTSTRVSPATWSGHRSTATSPCRASRQVPSFCGFEGF